MRKLLNFNLRSEKEDLEKKEKNEDSLEIEKGGEVAMMDWVAVQEMGADKTEIESSCCHKVVDWGVQELQPYPAMTHCELWIEEDRVDDDNHFSTYLGTDCGASWAFDENSSEKFYQKSSWTAIPVFAENAAIKVRYAIPGHLTTPYPSPALLYNYPWSVWPLRAFSGCLDDSNKAPAHCAALTARILRTSLSKDFDLPNASHWYGPSTLYLELSSPERMEASYARLDQASKDLVNLPKVQQDLVTLTQESVDIVAELSDPDTHNAMRAAAINVLIAGSRKNNSYDVDQNVFRDAQATFSKALMRHTWFQRKHLLEGRPRKDR